MNFTAYKLSAIALASAMCLFDDYREMFITHPDVDVQFKSELDPMLAQQIKYEAICSAGVYIKAHTIPEPKYVPFTYG